MTAGEATIWVPRGAGINYDEIRDQYHATDRKVICIPRVTYPDCDGTALPTLLDGERVRLAEVGTPETTSNGDDAQLGDDDGGTDSSSDFLGGLDTETDVALGIANNDNSLESGSLTGTGLLLDGLDLQRGEQMLASYSTSTGTKE